MIIKTSDIDVCPICPVIAQSCNNCKVKKDYGDTKEQLIKKVAQVIFLKKIKALNKICREILSKKDSKRIYEKCLEIAKEIVEFLGVEE